MRERTISPNPTGSGHRKRRREPDASRSSRRESARKPRRRRTPGGDGTRRWTFSPCDLSACKSRFVVVSYNILGVENASKHLDLYHQISPEHLNWGQRKRQICKEKLTALMIYPIFCANVATLVFIRVGLERQVMGVLHFGSKNKNIEYRRHGLRDNVAQLCLLKVCGNQSGDANSEISEPMSSKTVLVGNIHVLFNPNRGDIKLGQIRLLLERANMVSLQWGNSPVVICGDLNSIPQSALYQFLSSPELDILMYDRKKISGQIELSSRQIPLSIQGRASSSPCCMMEILKFKWSEEEILLASGSRGCTRLKNPLKLFSAYEGVPGCCSTRDNSGEPLVTSYHSKFMGTVDYIWHSAALVPVAVVETLPIKILKKLGGLPSEKWGSDHLALVCELAFVDDASQS